MHRPYRSEVLGHLGLVAGMFGELSIGEVLDRPMNHTPETRLVTLGSAAKAMVLNRLGFVNQLRYLVPMFFHNNPTERLIAPGVKAQYLHTDTLGRALTTLYDDGVTPLYSLMAATTAQRLGLAPTCAHLDCTHFPADGRDTRAAAPAEQVIQIIRGYSRDHRPALHHVRLDVSGAHQARIPRLMNPCSGHNSDVHGMGQVVTEDITLLQTTDGSTTLMADSVRHSTENHQKAGCDADHVDYPSPRRAGRNASRPSPSRSADHDPAAGRLSSSTGEIRLWRYAPALAAGVLRPSPPPGAVQWCPILAQAKRGRSRGLATALPQRLCLGCGCPAGPHHRCAGVAGHFSARGDRLAHAAAQPAGPPKPSRLAGQDRIP
jgi:hypothetical protein